MCHVFRLDRSGFYSWMDKPLSNHAIEDQRLLRRIKEFYVASGGTYGSPWSHRDLRDAGEVCSVRRVARIMRENKLKAQIGCKRRYIKGGKLGSITDNVLDRNLNPGLPNQAWVSDITYVRTHDGFLSVATGLDLFSRRIVGWSMDKNIDRHLVIRALMMAVWQRQPKGEVLVHSDQGSQYSSSDYLAFMKANNLKPSMTMPWQRVSLLHFKSGSLNARYTQRARMPKQRYLILSRCSTIRLNDLVTLEAFLQCSLKKTIFSG